MPPAGFKRSRAVWDNALRRPPHDDDSQWEAWKSWFQAVAYELQPVRGMNMNIMMGNNNNNQTSLAEVAMEIATRILYYIKVGGRALYDFITTTLPAWTAIVYRFAAARTLRQWSMVAGVVLYYGAVRYIHYILEAGPLVLIATALVAIFTVGLGDEQNDDGISAYSVFNRGFQRLMGSVDADQLLAQHVGGAMGMGGFMGGAGGAGVGAGGGGANVMGLQEPRRRNQMRHERQEENDVDRPPAAAAAENNAEDSDDENGDNNNNRRAAARQSGKKARRRRRNLDQRREIRQQREAAAAMGFGGGGGNGNPAEVEAMQRLLDDQVVVMDEADVAAAAAVED